MAEIYSVIGHPLPPIQIFHPPAQQQQRSAQGLWRNQQPQPASFQQAQQQPRATPPVTTQRTGTRRKRLSNLAAANGNTNSSSGSFGNGSGNGGYQGNGGFGQQQQQQQPQQQQQQQQRTPDTRTPQEKYNDACRELAVMQRQSVPSQSPHPYINGRQTYYYDKQNPLCVGCGEHGHQKRDCNGNPLPLPEQQISEGRPQQQGRFAKTGTLWQQQAPQAQQHQQPAVQQQAPAKVNNAEIVYHQAQIDTAGSSKGYLTVADEAEEMPFAAVDIGTPPPPEVNAVIECNMAGEDGEEEDADEDLQATRERIMTRVMETMNITSKRQRTDEGEDNSSVPYRRLASAAQQEPQFVQGHYPAPDPSTIIKKRKKRTRQAPGPITGMLNKLPLSLLPWFAEELKRKISRPRSPKKKRAAAEAMAPPAPAPAQQSVQQPVPAPQAAPQPAPTGPCQRPIAIPTALRPHSLPPAPAAEDEILSTRDATKQNPAALRVPPPKVKGMRSQFVEVIDEADMQELLSSQPEAESYHVTASFAVNTATANSPEEDLKHWATTKTSLATVRAFRLPAKLTAIGSKKVATIPQD
ncbi:hypothetical protein LTR87_017374 [Friedmanniomyces endolithicus]|nr:hypothetical protein LTR87_017374 [Friedmanniomyces endolithicus]